MTIPARPPTADATAWMPPTMSGTGPSGLNSIASPAPASAQILAQRETVSCTAPASGVSKVVSTQGAPIAAASCASRSALAIVVAASTRTWSPSSS